MDTSKYFVRMCKKAGEVQAFWQPKNGDFFWGTPQDFFDEVLVAGIYQYFECDDDFYSTIPRFYDPIKKEFTQETDAVRLPSQADLQAMLQYELPIDLVKDFANWTALLTIKEQERHQTMEQLWLGFVMKTNYQKIWNGREWIQDQEK